jgi:hypothetical protein
MPCCAPLLRLAQLDANQFNVLPHKVRSLFILMFDLGP